MDGPPRRRAGRIVITPATEATDFVLSNGDISKTYKVTYGFFNRSRAFNSIMPELTIILLGIVN